MTGECTERERADYRATKRDRANRQVSASRRERAAKLKRTGEDGYRGRIKRVTRRQRATRR